jgi:hypothetical protein
MPGSEGGVIENCKKTLFIVALGSQVTRGDCPNRAMNASMIVELIHEIVFKTLLQRSKPPSLKIEQEVFCYPLLQVPRRLNVFLPLRPSTHQQPLGHPSACPHPSAP